jgi:hypothetical protein
VGRGGASMVMKTAFLFPGQGSQYVGMGKEFLTISPRPKLIFERAEARLGREYIDVIFPGPKKNFGKPGSRKCRFLLCPWRPTR